MRLNSLSPRGLWPVCLLTALLPSGTASAQRASFCPGPQAAPGAEEAYREGLAAMGGPQQLGQPAADIRGIDATGAGINLARFKGQVILLDVSAMWCVFCKQDAAPLQFLYQTYGSKGLAVVTCLTEDVNGAAVNQSGLQQWVNTYHLTQPVMNDTSGTWNGVAESVYVQATGGFPTLVLIDKAFNVQYIRGGLVMPEVTAMIDKLLAQ
jgi:thiol-disulfide isomerase/thioredoxin